MFLFGTVMNNKVTVTGIINRTESPPHKNNEWSIIIYTKTKRKFKNYEVERNNKRKRLGCR